MKKILTLLVCLVGLSMAANAGYGGALKWNTNYTYKQTGTVIEAIFANNSSAGINLLTVDPSKVFVYDADYSADFVESVELAEITIGNYTKTGLKITCKDLTAGNYTLQLNAEAVTWFFTYDYYNKYFTGNMTLEAATNGGGGGGEEPDPGVEYTDVTFGAVSFPHYDVEDWQGYWGKGNATADPVLAEVAEDAPACTLAGPNGSVAFTQAPYVGGSDLQGQLVFQIADNSPKGNYTLTIPQGYFKTVDGALNNAAAVNFSYEGPVAQYVNVELGDFSFPYYGNDTFKGYWGQVAVSTTPTLVEKVSGSETAVLRNSNWETVSFTSIPTVGFGGNAGKLYFQIADNTPAGRYTLVIPKGYFRVGDNTFNNEIQATFQYGPEPLIDFTLEKNGVEWAGEGFQLTIDPYTYSFSSDVKCYLEDAAGNTYQFGTQPRGFRTPCNYMNVMMNSVSGLPTPLTSYTLVVPEGYLTDSQGYKNSEIRFDFTYGEKPEPTAADIPVVLVKALDNGSQVSGTHSDTAISSVQIQVLAAVTDDSSTPLTKLAVVSGSPTFVCGDVTKTSYNNKYVQSNGTMWINVSIDATTPESVYNMVIPENMFTWEDAEGNEYYNNEYTLVDAFSVGTAPADPTADPVITFDGADVTITCETPGATIEYSYAVYDMANGYAVIDGKSMVTVYAPDADTANEVKFTMNMDEAPAGAYIYVEAFAYVGNNFSEDVYASTYWTVDFDAPVYEMIDEDGFVLPAGNVEDPEPVALAVEQPALPDGTMIRAKAQIKITNPNAGGQLVYTVGDAEEVTTEEHEVTLTVPDTLGDNFSFTAKVVPGDDDQYYNESAPLTFSMPITGDSLVLEMEAEGSDVKVFTLDGHAVKAADLQSGLYIVVRNGKATRTLVK